MSEIGKNTQYLMCVHYGSHLLSIFPSLRGVDVLVGGG